MRYSRPSGAVVVLLSLYLSVSTMLTVGGAVNNQTTTSSSTSSSTSSAAGSSSTSSSSSSSSSNSPCPPWLSPPPASSDHSASQQQLRRYVEQFSRILARFDCPQPYSVKFHCPQCKEAYMAWVCTSLYKYEWVDSKNRIRTVKPCRSFCHRVEQKCPFFLPLDKGPVHYAGEPTFLCLDPNIDETGEQFEKSSYGPTDCCYDLCATGVCVQGGCGSTEETEATREEGSSRGSRGANFPPPTSLLHLSSSLPPPPALLLSLALLFRHFI